MMAAVPGQVSTVQFGPLAEYAPNQAQPATAFTAPPPEVAAVPLPQYPPQPPPPQLSAEQMPGPASSLPLATATEGRQDLKAIKSTAEFALREYMSLQRSRYRVDVEGQLHAQAATVLTDLRRLRRELEAFAKAAESHRWRRWVVGGAM